MARVPGCIEYNNTIGANKIHSQTSSSGGDQEELDFIVGVKVVDQFFSVQRACAAVQSVVIDSSDPGILNKRINLRNIRVSPRLTSASVSFLRLRKSSMRFKVNKDWEKSRILSSRLTDSWNRDH